jgi:adenylate kinase
MIVYSVSRDELRKEVKSKSELGKSISSYLLQGSLIPDEIINPFVKSKLSLDSNPVSSSSFVTVIDGYPRTVEQCKNMDEFTIEKNIASSEALLIQVAEWVVIKKMLGRRQCDNCKQNFNICDIRIDGYDMPPILPNPETCPNKSLCQPILSSRQDDTEEIIMKRLKEYNSNISSILEYYNMKNKLKIFHIKKGISDTPNIIEMILNINISKS